MTAHTMKAAVPWMLVALALVLGGCGSGSGQRIMSVFQSKARQDLSAGIKEYECPLRRKFNPACG